MSDSKPLASLSSGLLARKGGARPAMRRQNVIANPNNSQSVQDDLGWNDMGYDVDPPKTAEPSDISGADANTDDRKANVLSAAIPEVVKQQDALHREYIDHAKPNAVGGSIENDAPKSVNSAHNNPERISSASVNPKNLVSESSNNAVPVAPVVETVDSHASPLLNKKASANKPVGQSNETVSDASSAYADDINVDAKLAAQNLLSKTSAMTPAAKQKEFASAKADKGGAVAAKNAASKRVAFTLRLERERHLRLRLACAIRNQSAQNMVTEALDALLATIPEIDVMANNLPENS